MTGARRASCCTAALLLCAGVPAVAQAPEAATDAATEAPGDGTATEAELRALPSAEPISFKAGLAKAVVQLAEPFDVNIEIRHPPTDRYLLPDKLELKEFSVRARSTETGDGNPATTRIRLTLQPFDVGEREIPALVLRVETPRGLRKYEIPAQKLRVEGVIDLSQGEPKMREDNRPLPTRHRTVWWPFAALGGLALAVLAFFWIRARLRRAKLAPPVPRPPPDAEALARLAELEAAGLVAAGRRQEYHFRLSEILRDYLGRRYGFDALECTTDELLAELRRRPTPGLEFDQLEQESHAADLVKFARRDPTDGECKRSLDFARSLVVRTTPAPAGTPAAAPPAPPPAARAGGAA